MMLAILTVAAALPAVGSDPQVVAAISAGVAAQLAQEAARRAADMAFYSLVVQTLGSIGIAWITYKQVQLGTNLGKLEINTNSMREELVKVTAKSSRAEGNLEGRAELAQEAQLSSPVAPVASPAQPAVVKTPA